MTKFYKYCGKVRCAIRVASCDGTTVTFYDKAYQK